MRRRIDSVEQRRVGVRLLEEPRRKLGAEDVSRGLIDAVRVLRSHGRQELGARRGEERAVGVASEVLVDAGH